MSKVSVIVVCANCGKVRRKTGQWRSLPRHISNELIQNFSHTTCPVCTKKLYPEIFAELSDRYS